MTRPPPVRVLVADDHPLFREALVDAVSRRADLEVVGEAGNWEEATEAVRRLRPDVGVMDVKMPGPDGPHLLAAIASERLPTRVLFLSAFRDAETVHAALAAGARGFLGKESGREAICDAIADVARGKTVLAPGLKDLVIRMIAIVQQQRRLLLTTREREVLQLVSQGRSNIEIAERLFLSPETVKTHLRNIFGKLDVSDRAAAVAEALRRGLID